jgi:hypothetical protein
MCFLCSLTPREVGTTWGVAFGVDSSLPLVFLSRIRPVSRVASRRHPSAFQDGLRARFQPYGLDAAVQGVLAERPQVEHSAQAWMVPPVSVAAARLVAEVVVSLVELLRRPCPDGHFHHERAFQRSGRSYSHLSRQVLAALLVPVPVQVQVREWVPEH